MKTILLLAALVCAPLSLSAQAVFTLQEAVSKGKISYRAEAPEGGSRGLVLYFSRLDKRPLKITIPAGQTFFPSDTTAQTLVSVKEEAFTLTKDAMFLRLKSYCAEAGDASPTGGERFTTGPKPSGPLQRLAAYISQQKLYDHPDVQSAVWCVTNRHAPAYLTHQGLLQTVCQIMATPLPKYEVKAAPVVERPGRRIEPPPPLSISGVFAYEAKQPCMLSLYVFNDKNERVKTFFENKEHRAAKITYTFSWKTTKMPRGDYEIRLLDGEKVVEKMKVRY